MEVGASDVGSKECVIYQSPKIEGRKFQADGKAEQRLRGGQVFEI